MGLTSALQVGRSGLLTSQAALQVAGNNLANMATTGYHRQRVDLTPAMSDELSPNAFVGQGVQLEAITRNVNEALEARLRGAVADQSHSTTRQDLLSQIESLENELSGSDLSTQLSSFFNAWSSLSNNPQDPSLRSMVADQAASLSSFVQNLRDDMANMRGQIDAQTDDAVGQVNSLLGQIEDLNHRIALASSASAGSGSGGTAASSAAASLKDQRGTLLDQLGQYLDISTVTHDNGVTDVFVGSMPIVLNGDSRGVALRTTTVDGQTQTDLVTADDQSPLNISSGKLGALVEFRKEDMSQAIDALDTFAGQLIWQVNRLHSQGQGLEGFTQVTGTAKVADATASLNSPDAELDFTPSHGSFQINVTQKSTGQTVTRTIHVDLDGINPATDTTLNSLAADIDATANISASVTADGRLKIASDSDDYEISFANDTSGVLAALGINTFFNGHDATDMAVNPVVTNNSNLIAAGTQNRPGDNTASLAIAGLQDQGVAELGGMSLSDFWRNHVEDFATRADQAKQNADADTVVQQNLQTRKQQVSGVNVDQATIDLMQYQRMYQASAQFISTVNQLMNTLMEMV